MTLPHSPNNGARAPVVLIIFNRPEETSRVFASIRQARPSELFIIADAPRNEEEKSLCEAARAIIKVDWPCEIRWNIAPTNLGAGKRVYTGLDWVFNQAERAIILEDDCLADPTFFPFCEELLEKYSDDTRVMCISGTCLPEQDPYFSVSESYFCTTIPITNGWATWRRAWRLYDIHMRAWPALRDRGAIKDKFPTFASYERFANRWDEYYAGKIPNSWDGPWAFACVAYGGFCIHSSVNLISNIGFNERATQTKTKDRWAEMPLRAMHFPLIHPKELLINKTADAFVFRENFGVDKKFHHRLLRPLKNRFPVLYQKIKEVFR